MPSLWLYLKQLDPEVPELFFGVCLGAFNASQMLFSPLFGYWLDRRPMKEVVVFCLAVGIIGNSVYVSEVQLVRHHDLILLPTSR